MTLFLSRVLLNARSRRVRHDLADCHAFHRSVMSAFPTVDQEHARAELGVLYRVEEHPARGGLALVVQARQAPDWSDLRRSGYLSSAAGEPEIKPVADRYAAIKPGQRLRFRLRANPTRRLSTPPRPDGTRPAGKRVDLRDEADQISWIERKGAAHGFALVRARARPDIANTRVQPEPARTGTRVTAVHGGAGTGERISRRLTFGAVLFEGELVVTDAEALQSALADGIGSGKAYGFGLLSVAPVGEE